MLFVLVGWCVRANLPSAIGSHVILGFLVFGVPYCIYCFCIARYFAFWVTGEFAFFGLIFSSWQNSLYLLQPQHAVAKCSFRHFCLLPMISEFAWRIHVISPVHRFWWNQVLLLLGFENLQQGFVLGDGVGNVFQTYLIFMWDTTAWCLSQTSGIQMSGMSSACRVCWTGQQLNKRDKSFEFSKLQFCPEMVLSM